MNNLYIVIFLVIFLFRTVSAQNIIINEFVSSNKSTFPDLDNEFNDWIELYNNGAQQVNLLNYSLSDDSLNLRKWVFPEVILSPSSYLTIFSSGKDRVDPTELHTNFKISKLGEPLFLSNDMGNVISYIDPVVLPADKSFGCLLDGSTNMTILNTPTPNSSNINGDGIYCSHKSGFYIEDFLLTLTSSDSTDKIYYTLNGENPTAESYLYSGPISITDNSYSEFSISSIPTTPLEGPDPINDIIWKEPQEVYKSTIIRFASFEENTMKSIVYTKSFFVDSNITTRYKFPIISLITDSLNLYDYDTGIYIPGKRFDEAGFNWWPEGNYHNRGDLWERNIHISYFESNGTIAFETNAGMRMRGYGSASLPQKSFQIYFRDEYGRSNIQYPIFESSNNVYKRIILRNSGNDFLYTHFRDVMLQEVIKSIGLELQNFRPSILFINGEYWGIHNMREKYDKFFFEYNFGYSEEEINILGVCGDIEEGDNKEYVELANFINIANLSVDANYNYVSDKIDIQNFIDYQIAEIYFANYDWPCNNYKMWKSNNPDSKWRFLIYDLDWSFGFDDKSLASTNSISHAVSIENQWPYCDCSNLFFRKLLENESFRDDFIDRFAYHLNYTFNSDTIIDIINKFQELFSSEMEEHIKRWNYPSDIDQWEKEIDILKEFALDRPCDITNYIMTYFDLKAFDLDCISDDLDYNGDLLLLPNPNNGNFFIYNNSNQDIIKGSIIIVNSIGKIVYSEKNVSVKSKQRKNLFLYNIPNGTYLLGLRTKEKVETKKLIIIRDL